MNTVLHNIDNKRRLVGGWLLLALSAFTLSTVCAVLLIAARAPLPEALAGFGNLGALFGRALVLHVGFAVVVWFLACAAAMWTLAASGPASTWQWGALALAGIGLPAMLVPLFSGVAHPVLANYVPVLDHPVFLAGLSVFIVGVALCAATTLRGMARLVMTKDAQPWRVGALFSIVAAAIALAALLGSLASAGIPAGPEEFETVVWGPGHLMQFVHVLLVMTVWIVLYEQITGAPVAAPRWLLGVLFLAIAPVLGAPFIYLNYPVGSGEFRHAFTLLMAWGCWPAAVLLGMQILRRLLTAGRDVRAAPQAQALLASVLLFFVGCLLGALIRNDSTMVPAHYHGTVGAVTLAYMAFGYQMLPVFGAHSVNRSWVSRQVLLYGSGLTILALALAWSGWLGVPRKTPHADIVEHFPAYIGAMAAAGLGGVLAVAGAVLFVVNIIVHLRNVPKKSEAPVGRRDVRLKALLLTLLLTAFTGMLLAYWPGELARPATMSVDNAATHVTQKQKEEIARRFAEGVERLKAREYEAAASALHRVLQLAPQMPEAHVNMGFALIGLKKYAMARDFFEAAISLRTTQMNAYYGLGIALAETGDVAGALGAMRTYVHRAKSNDPYLRTANAAIWEWDSQLKSSRIGKANELSRIPNKENDAARHLTDEKQTR